MTEGLPEDWRKRIVAWARSTSQVYVLYLFGSRAAGTHAANSDLDLAVEVQAPDEEDRNLVWFDFGAQWERELGTLVPVRVDLQFFDEANDEIVAPSVAKCGAVLFCRGADKET